MYYAPVGTLSQDDNSGTSLAEILGAFSYALDLTEGQPEGHSLRTCWIASQMAAAAYMTPAERRTIYYATLLKDLGCSSNAARIAEVYLADDRAFKHDFKLLPQGIGPTLRFVFAATGRGEALSVRAKAVLHILRDGSAIARELIQTRCTRGADIARQLRFPEEVANAIAALDEHWDGSGKPLGLQNHAIPTASQFALLGQIADVFHSVGGAQAAHDEVAARSGTWFDPAVVKLFQRVAAEDAFWAGLSDPLLEIRVRDLEPQEQRVAVDADYLDAIAAAFGAVIDAKSPFTGGHSTRVGDYAALVGGALGFAPEPVRELRRAAVLHDVGKLAVSSRILEKPGKLDEGEWDMMRNHAAQTTSILSRITPFRRMAAIAGAHHERLDGRGYPLGLDQLQIAREARIITVCDFYDALTADRPYRAAMPVDEALAVMESEVGRAIDGDCFATLRDIVTGSPEAA